MSADNHVIIIPGLGNWVREHIWVLSSWKKLGIIPHVFDAKWRIEENGFQPKLEKAISLIDLITNKKARVSIIGNSAGSSFAINLYARRKKQ
ncbi:hypothetical protein HY214_00370, partial [Candidatus Roizmanbacteria bacterium]|nr:hypothetical protein [Candidatus Roizmanbacteria bacterium]